MPHKLLLADDSVTIQRVIELTFADEDVEVLAVGDGKQAIVRARVDHPDIILADVGMPERDGYEVSSFIKGTPELAHIPVLLLTGAFEPIDEARAKAAGCDGVLVKPFEPQMVIARVKELLAGRRPAWTGTDSKPAVASGTGDAAAVPTVEEYFDRLDAAFAGLERTAGAPPPGSTGTPASDAGIPSASTGAVSDATPVAATRPAVEPIQPEQAEPRIDAPLGTAPTLADAFAALLAAEQNRPVAPAAIQAGALSGDVIDDIVTRVVQRLSDRAVREMVLDVAERLVREEIARIKSGR